MTKESLTYLSADKKTTIYAYKWIPDGEINAILQISHGMVEHIDRYDDFATYLANKGVLVVGNNHLGHGNSVESEEKLGYFSEENGNLNVVEDINTLRTLISSEYKDKPYFILGHSMGSFLVRQYIIKYGEGLSGAIIMGTAFKPTMVTKMGMCMCQTIAKSKGWTHRSPFIDNMGMGGYNKKFGEKAGKDWLSKNPENVKKNLADPLANFQFTINGYYNLFKTLNFVCTKSNLKNMPKDLPILFVSGDDDPVGDYKKGVLKVYNMFIEAGMKDVTLKFYETYRHEILNENDEQVYIDILDFINR